MTDAEESDGLSEYTSEVALSERRKPPLWVMTTAGVLAAALVVGAVAMQLRKTNDAPASALAPVEDAYGTGVAVRAGVVPSLDDQLSAASQRTPNAGADRQGASRDEAGREQTLAELDAVREKLRLEMERAERDRIGARRAAAPLVFDFSNFSKGTSE